MGVGKGNLEPANNVSAVWLKHGEGRLVNINFGFIFEISPGGYMRIESAHFILT
ncbi:putative 1-phosphatidylinositol 4-kinase [Helianthus annuus]|nr:putative 1-phosphatidylinositol 4-kinase [Helianthus annuus]